MLQHGHQPVLVLIDEFLESAGFFITNTQHQARIGIAKRELPAGLTDRSHECLAMPRPAPPPELLNPCNAHRFRLAAAFDSTPQLAACGVNGGTFPLSHLHAHAASPQLVDECRESFLCRASIR